MDLITQATNAFHSVPSIAWPSILAVIGVSAFQQKIKNWLELENPKVLVFMTSVFALAGAAIPAMLGWISANPSSLAGNSALWFSGLTLAYRYVIQPGENYLNGLKGDYANYRNYRLNKAVQPTAEASQAADAALESLASETQPTVTEAPAVPAGVSPTFEG